MTLLGICNLGVGDGRMWLGNHFVWLLYLKTVRLLLPRVRIFVADIFPYFVWVFFLNDSCRLWRISLEIYTGKGA